MISFTIPMCPKSLQFSGKRLSVRGKTPIFFKTKEASSWENLVRFYTKSYAPKEPLTRPVILNITFVFDRPKYMTEKKYGAGRVAHAAKPDRTNILKSLEDCLNAFWLNDSQVFSGSTVKLYGRINEPACIEVSMSELPETGW